MTYQFTMDCTDLDTPESLEGKKSVPRGQYHVRCIGVKDATDKESRVFGFQIELEVLAGTNSGGIGGTFKTTYGHPATTDKDGGKFRKALLCRLLVASGAASREAVLGKQFTFDPNWLLGRQFIVATKLSERGYAEIDGMNLWHLTDKEGSHVPRNNPEAERYLSSEGASPAIGQPANSFAGV